MNEELTIGHEPGRVVGRASLDKADEADAPKAHVLAREPPASSWSGGVSRWRQSLLRGRRYCQPIIGPYGNGPHAGGQADEDRAAQEDPPFEHQLKRVISLDLFIIRPARALIVANEISSSH